MLGYVQGADVFLIFSLLLFLLFFIGTAIYIVKMDKNTIEEMENLPLQTDELNHNVKP